ncbi:MAG: DoxX family membrane protein [Deltaproteobacteria bacterium]|nr:DoxX family membrane protein [Deltaproteobacteria bacterium]
MSGWTRFAGSPIHALFGGPVRVVLGIVFVYASLYKIAEPREFAMSIALYDMLPLSLVNLLAITLPVVELVAGVTLLLGFWTRASAAVVNGMLLLFIAAIGYVVFVRGRAEFGCGCFSPAAAEAGKELATDTLWRDAAYLAGGMYVMVFDDGALGLDGLRRRLRAGRRNDASKA